MRIPRSQLVKIIREEAARLREGGINDKISAYNGEFFRLVDAVRDLAAKMDVEPKVLYAEISSTLRGFGSR